MKHVVAASILALPFLMMGCTSTGALDVGQLKALTDSLLFGDETLGFHDHRVKDEFIKQTNQQYCDILPQNQKLAWAASLECRNRPDGLIRYSRNNLAWETVVKNGKSSQFLRAYKNGKIVFDYSLANETINGWGAYHLKGGEITKVLFKNNHIIKWEHYLADDTFYASGEP